MSNPLRTLIVDDDSLVREQLSAFVEAHDGVVLAGACESAVDAINRLEAESFDLLLLDVEMPLMTGIELVRHLEHRPQIIFVTGKADYAVDAFDIDVTDFLLKPVSYARFAKAVKRAVRQAQTVTGPVADTPDDYVFVKSEGRLVKLDLKTIRYVEAQGDYMMFHTEDASLLVHGTMKGMQASLPDAAFVRVHRSYIVRLDSVVDIEDNSLVLGRSVIPIGASYKTGLLERLRML